MVHISKNKKVKDDEEKKEDENYLNDDEDFIKELFMKNISNSKQLSELIDKYLIPQELEKKKNAEVSTVSHSKIK